MFPERRLIRDEQLANPDRFSEHRFAEREKLVVQLLDLDHRKVFHACVGDTVVCDGRRSAQIRRLRLLFDLLSIERFQFAFPGCASCKKCAAGFSFLVGVDLKLLEKPVAFVRIEPDHLFPDFQKRDSPFSDPVVDGSRHDAITGGKFWFRDELTLR
jgi:hypothetical protein